MFWIYRNTFWSVFLTPFMMIVSHPDAQTTDR